MTLSNDGVILCPTDTIWGLHANALLPESINRIAAIKQRPPEKNFITLFASIDSVKAYLVSPLDIDWLQEKYDDRPTTFITRGFSNKLDHLKSDDGYLAFRIPQSGLVSTLLQSVCFPLISTSANISGMPSPVQLADVSTAIIEKVDFLAIDDEVAEDPDTRPSRIIKILEDGAVEVIRN